MRQDWQDVVRIMFNVNFGVAVAGNVMSFCEDTRNLQTLTVLRTFPVQRFYVMPVTAQACQQCKQQFTRNQYSTYVFLRAEIQKCGPEKE